MPFKLELVTDTAGAVRGVKDFGDALDDVADALDEVARTSDTKTRNVGDDLEKVGREAGDAAEKVEKKFRDAFREVERDAGTKTKQVADDTKRNIADRGGEAVGEFKDEAKSNLSEVASSFSGDIDSAADLVQGTLGGLVQAGGPIGAIGAAGAIAAGVFYNAWREKTEEAKARVSEMYDDMLQSGQDFLSDQLVADNISKIVTGAEDAAVSLDTAKAAAQELGVPLEDVVAAFAGSTDAQDKVLGKIEEQREALALLGLEGRGNKAAEIIALNDIEGAIKGVNGEYETAREQVALARNATYTYTSANAELKKSLDDSIGYYGGRTWQTRIEATAETATAERRLQDFIHKKREVIIGVSVRNGTAVI